MRRVRELSAISDEISSAFTDGVGIDEGAVLDEQQIEAVRQLGEPFAAVEIADEGLLDLRDDVVDAAAAVLLQAAAGEALTADAAGGLTGAILQLGSLCESGICDDIRAPADVGHSGGLRRVDPAAIAVRP